MIKELAGDNGAFFYEAGIVTKGLVLVSGDKNQPLENLIEKLKQAKQDKRPYFYPNTDNKIQIFHHTQGLKLMFDPLYTNRLGDIHELTDEDYQKFVNAMQELSRS